MKEISAGVIVYQKTREGIKFLLLYHGGGYWNFPKGKIESPKQPFEAASGQTTQRETSWQAAVREIREETGLRLGDLKFRRQFKTLDRFVFYRERRKIFKIVILYLAETNKLKIDLSDEHDGYAWLTYKEAMKILKYKDSQRIITQANNFLRRPYQPSENPAPNIQKRIHRPNPIGQDRRIFR